MGCRRCNRIANFPLDYENWVNCSFCLGMGEIATQELDQGKHLKQTIEDCVHCQGTGACQEKPMAND